MFTGSLQQQILDQQMHQNQLIISLNQSYFELVASQSSFIERFNRIEQFTFGNIDAKGVPSAQQKPLPMTYMHARMLYFFFSVLCFSRLAKVIEGFNTLIGYYKCVDF